MSQEQPVNNPSVHVESEEEKQRAIALNTILVYLIVAQQRGAFMFHESAQ